MNKCKKCGEQLEKKNAIYCNKEIIKSCEVCNKEIITQCNSRERKLCSQKCVSTYGNMVQKKRREEGPKIYKKCEMCGKEFHYKKKTKDGVIGCSPLCRFQIRNGPRNCNYCNKEYMPKSATSKVCSLECAGQLAQSPKAREKRKNTNIKKFGVENVFANEEIKEKIKSVNIERYGVESPIHNEEIRNKINNTMLKRYGVIHPLQNKDILNKVQKTNIEKYGDICSLNNEKVKAKKHKTMLKRYGSKEPFKSAEIKEKIKKTNLKRYGAENPFGSDLIKEKIKKTNLKRYGAENYSNRETLEEELKARDDKVIELYSNGKTEYEIAELLNYEYITIRRILLKNEIVTANNITQINKYWAHIINRALGIEFKHEGKIFTDKRKSVDLYNEAFKLAIDINPTITHSTQETPFPNRRLLTVKHHQERALDAQENGWELIQIFDWDSEDDIIELLRSKFGMNKRIYARKCKVKEITHKESKIFLDANHRQQGKANSSIQYGLFHKDELIQVMTFSKERFSRNKKIDSYELLRLASKRGITVVGGASKLLTAFQKSNNKPNTIKTFVDFSKGTGESYEKIGMTYEGFANLNAFYSSIYTNEAYKVTEVTNKFKKEYSKLGQTQKEYMNKKGFYRINDAGHKIFKWERT